jgi:hypothetical protein
MYALVLSLGKISKLSSILFQAGMRVGSGLYLCCSVILNQSADGRVVEIKMLADFNLSVPMMVNRVCDQLIALGFLLCGLIKELLQSRSSEKPLLLWDFFDHVFAGHMIRQGFGKPFGAENALSLKIFPDYRCAYRFSDIFPVFLLGEAWLGPKVS